MSRVGVVALARPTFDVAFAEETSAAAFALLDDVAPGWIGRRELLFDAAATQAALDELSAIDFDALVVMQATFTDATMTNVVAESVEAPLVLWAFPEARTGGRLRLNSLCGINLAAYALRRSGHRFTYLFRDASEPATRQELAAAINGTEPEAVSVILDGAPDVTAHAAAESAVNRLRQAKTGVIGRHPDGFDPCGFDVAEVSYSVGVDVQPIELGELFVAAAAASAQDVADARTRAARALGSLDELDQEALDQSLRIYCGLKHLVTNHGWDGFATRCWPECFTEFGAAACAPQAMMTEDGVPGGCEADAYGTLTSLLLKELAGEAPFVADLVDVDLEDDTAVFWHCGLAPLHMADPAVTPRPTVHSNRRKPLLHEFPLKPGRVTIARISQAGGEHSLVIGGGEMVRAPLAFSGTAGVVRLDSPSPSVLRTIMVNGLEHHYGIVYGDFRSELGAVAQLWDMPVIALS